MAIEVQAPQEFRPFLHSKYVTIFAGGSIEMGKAKPWQKKLVRAFTHEKDVVILNPRRDDWDSSWKQSKHNKHFRQQVLWELQALEDADIVIIFFDPATSSPISLLELGLYGGMSSYNCHVICPKGFWRKGNVDIVCDRFNIVQHDNLKSAISHIKKHMNDYRR